MELTIEVPENIVKEAEARDMPVMDLVQEKLNPEPLKAENLDRNSDEYWLQRGFKRFGDSNKTPEEAVASMLENRKKYPLGDVTIRQLIEEGRRY